MKRKHALTALAVALLAAGCTLAPRYERPAAPVSGAFPADGVYAAQPGAAPGARSANGQAAVDIGWREFFVDPRLQRLIEIALKNNRDLRVSVLNVEASRAQYQITRAGLFPTLSGTGTGTIQRTPAGVSITGQPLISRTYNVGVSASWELDLFGRVRRSVEAAGAQTQAAIEGRNDALLSLEAEVAQTYLQLRGAQALRALAVALADEQRDVVALTRDQARKGLSSELDVQSADARLAQLRAQLPQFDQQIALLRNGLSYLLGDAPGALDDALREPRALPELPPTVPIGLPSTLARRRPDIRRAEAQLHAATAGVGVAVAQFYPDVSLTGQVGTRATHARELAHWSHLFYAFGPSVSLPIFEGGALVANLRLSQAQQAQAALGYRRAVLLALRDVDNALAAYRTDQTRRDALRDAAAAERTTFELARDSYRHGLVSFIDVLDAERELSQARQQYVQGSLQLTTDLVSLYKALGGGWQPAPAAQTPAPAALDAPTQDTPLGATAPARR